MEWISRVPAKSVSKTMAISTMTKTYLVLTALILGISSLCSGAVIMTVNPYPARIYTGAPAGVPILRVRAYENTTGIPARAFRLEKDADADYFQIGVDGILSTKTPIPFTPGKILQYFVFGLMDIGSEYKHVQIIVSAKNTLPPYFEKGNYDMTVYRYGVGDLIGHVTARDDDEEPYNSQVTVIPEELSAATQYVDIGGDGSLYLLRIVPDHISSLAVTLLAVDGGSPQMTASTVVNIDVVMVKHPDTFCVSTTPTTTTVCWKNPMPQLIFDGYNISVTGAVERTEYLPNINEKEACFTLNGTSVGNLYIFTVTSRSQLGVADKVPSVNFNKSGIGYVQDCVDQQFSVCVYRYPCNHHGMCMANRDPLKYTCVCDDPWTGENCTLRDLCTSDPCQNGGRCKFLGHDKYECECPDGFFGENCQHYNTCLVEPCENSGTCVLHSNGTFVCNCQPLYSGQHCEVSDPCSPSPCVAGQGQCVRLTESAFRCDCDHGYYGDRCQEVDACELVEVPCQNGGTCLQSGPSFTCACPPVATGQYCEQPDPCYIQPCENNGNCSMGETGSYKCACPPGYTGNECQHADLCYNVDCNAGTCVHQFRDATFRCECPEGFSGKLCEVFDICETFPCNNHGNCSSFGEVDAFKSEFQCDCFVGWYGKDCNLIDDCSAVVCENGGVCQNVPSVGYQCICKPGYYLSDCSAFDPCSLRQCLNGASCRNLSQTEYLCECTEDWVGELCDQESPCSPAQNPCQNGGICESVEEPGTARASIGGQVYKARCQCPAGTTPPHCELLPQSCSPSPCVHGTCRPVTPASSGSGQASLFTCDCDAGYTGALCDQRLTTCEGVVCSNGGYCVGGRCLCAPGSTAKSCPAVSSSCQEMQDDDYICTCENGEQTCSKNSMAKLNTLLDNTSDPSSLTADQVNKYADVLLDLYKDTLVDTNITKVALEVLSNLAKVNVSVSEEVERRNQTNTKLREYLNNYTSDVDLTSTDGVVSVSGTELHVQAVSLQKALQLSNASVQFEPYLADNGALVQLNMTIELPRTLLNDTANQLRDTRLQFIAFRRSQLFVPSDGLPDSQLISQQRVISASVKGRELKNLSEPVIIRLPPIETGANHTCVFWDPENRNWSTRGVVTRQPDLTSGTVTCESDHLTSFAVLLDVNPGSGYSKAHEKALTFITYIGCSISLASLLITIITYGLFRSLNQEKSGKILLNLCAALVCLNVTFLVASVDVSDFSDGGCLAAALLLHYFLLAALMWMLVEAVEMYQALVTVFTKYERLYLLKRLLVAWGTPGVIVGITAAADVDSYYSNKETKQLCFLTSDNPAAYYTALIAPASIILIINTVVFVMVARVILKPKFQQQLSGESFSITPAQIRGAFTVMFLMGVTWVFGPLAINEAKLFFSYLFCICNSLQGFLIFVFRCLFNPEAKLAWIQLVQTGTLKRRRGPIVSVYSDSTSKGVDHRRPSASNSGYNATSSTATTRTSLGKNGNVFHPHPHQLHTTNGWHPNINGMKRDKKDGQAAFGSQNGSGQASNGRRQGSPGTESAGSFKKHSPSNSSAGATYEDDMTHF